MYLLTADNRLFASSLELLALNNASVHGKVKP